MSSRILVAANYHWFIPLLSQSFLLHPRESKANLLMWRSSRVAAWPSGSRVFLHGGSDSSVGTRLLCSQGLCVRQSKICSCHLGLPKPWKDPGIEVDQISLANLGRQDELWGSGMVTVNSQLKVRFLFTRPEFLPATTRWPRNLCVLRTELHPSRRGWTENAQMGQRS